MAAMLVHYGTTTGMKIARKHIGWYSKGLPDSAEFRSAINRSEAPDVVGAMIDAFYERQAEIAAAEALVA